MRSPLLSRFKPLAMAIHLSTVTLGLALCNTAHAANQIQVSAGALHQALSQYALQQNVNLIVDSKLLAGYQSSGLQGAFEIEEGFNQLLRQTPYQIVKLQNGYSLIAKKNAAQAPSHYAGQLAAINVDAAESAESTVAVLPTMTVDASEQQGLKKQTESGALGTKSILDTPFSITVVDSDDVFKRGAKTVGQIFINDPAVYSHTAAMATDWWGTSIRGLGVRNYFVDGLPMTLVWGGDFPIEAVESVTALKGLSGFMYGFGAPGGAISYQLKRTKASPETSVELSYRNPSMFSALLDHSDYIDALDLGYRISLGGDIGESYNTADQKRYLASLALDKKINQKLTWAANFSYENNKTEGEPPIFSLSSVSGGLPKANYDYDHLSVDNAYFKTNTFIASSSLNWAFNAQWALKYQLAYSRKEHESNLVFNYLNNAAGDYSGYLYQFADVYDSLMNQLQLNGLFMTGKIKHQLVAGVGFTQSSVKDSDYYWASAYTGNINQDQAYRINHAADYSLNPKSSETTQSYGFISDTLYLGEHWQAILGLRHTYYDSEDLDYDPTSNSGYSTTATTPTYALIYKPTAEMSFYASYVESLEEGGIVGATYANAGQVLDPTISKQYELGLKYDLQPVAFTAAAFKIERAATMDSMVNGATYLTQDGVTDYLGLELNGDYRASDRLKLGLGLMYLDSSIEKVAAASKSVEGNRPAGVAKWSGAAQVDYRLGAIEGLSVHANLRYNGSSYTSRNNSIEVPSYSVVSTGFSYQFKLNGRDAVLNGNINNLFNKKYWASSGSWGSIGEAINGVLALKVKW
jgi:iron complex outermembrane receptor protein